MGEKTSKNTPDSNFGALAEAIVYLADKIREGCADVADGLRHERPLMPSAHYRDNQIGNTDGRSQAEKNEDFTLRGGADEIPDMRDDAPLPKFGRKAP